MKLIESFERIFINAAPKIVSFSPGRVNLIGEHIDYNGGYVMPAAISMGTYGVIAKRDDALFRLYSENFSHIGVVTLTPEELWFNAEHDWANFVKGTLFLLQKEGHPLNHGFDLYLEGNLPTASGLSSSASLELLVGFLINHLYQLGLSKQQLALLGQRVENQFMGANTGIMDQLIIALGIQNKALLMNTNTFDVQPTDAKFDGYQLVIMDTHYQRQLTDSKYNQRRQECEKALAIIQTAYPVQHLCELSIMDLSAIKTLLNDDLLYRRVRHVVTEQHRTLDAFDVMHKQDIESFGQLLNQSHESLRDDYEVTGFHLDCLQESALRHGAIGCRVTGAGFGGCAIAYVKDERVSHFMEAVCLDYQHHTGITPSFYQVTFENGVGEWHGHD